MNIKKEHKTKRLNLRPWRESDAEALFKYASDPRVGPIAGWPVHENIEYSRQTIRDVFSRDGIYAITLKDSDEAIGCIGLLTGGASDFGLKDDEGELAYWLGVPFWGQGLVPEAMKELMRYAFKELDFSALYCGYFRGNEKSARAQEKCGFKYLKTNENKYWELTDDIRTEIITKITKEEWQKEVSL